MTFEEKLFAGKYPKERTQGFRNACLAIFGTPQGKYVLAALCGAAHPLQHTADMTAHDHGQREVVATLWRYGANEAALPEPNP